MWAGTVCRLLVLSCDPLGLGRFSFLIFKVEVFCFLQFGGARLLRPRQRQLVHVIVGLELTELQLSEPFDEVLHFKVVIVGIKQLEVVLLGPALRRAVDNIEGRVDVKVFVNIVEDILDDFNI